MRQGAGADMIGPGDSCMKRAFSWVAEALNGTFRKV